MIGTVLAQGAAVTSLGIALATWVPRLDRAVTLSAAASVFLTVAWVPLAALLFLGNKDLSLGMASASPLFGLGVLTNAIGDARLTQWPTRVGWRCGGSSFSVVSRWSCMGRPWRPSSGAWAGSGRVRGIWM